MTAAASSRIRPEPLDYRPPMHPYLQVLYHDRSIVVLSKPAGLLNVPGKLAAHSDCLELRVRSRFPEALTVHRLDRATSGVVVMGIGKAAHRHLSMQFQKRQTHKTYVAEVLGKVGEERGTIALPLRCDWPNRPLQIVDHALGKPAVTHFERLSYSRSSSRMRLVPVTGRSHQLRVHMLHLGHPILGDNFYGGEAAQGAADRLLLHAQSLTLYHPEDGRTMTFEDPCPF